MPESRSVFDAAQDPELLHGLALVTGVAADAGAAQLAPASHEKPAAASCEEKAHGVSEVPERMCCLTCGQVFGSREEQTEHYRLDWHRFNLKQRLLGRRTLPAEVFEEKTRTGDVSSISGSDSDSSDVSSESELLPSVSDTPTTPQIPRSHKVLFRNAKGQLISAYRCVLVTGKRGRKTETFYNLGITNTHRFRQLASLGGHQQEQEETANNLQPSSAEKNKKIKKGRGTEHKCSRQIPGGEGAESSR